MASENFYSGGIYSNDPNYRIKNPYFTPTGYQANFNSLGMAVDARTANQLKEVSEALNTGIKSIEVGPVDPSVFESIPKEHFVEMRRAAKLAGKSTELTFHAPMIDPTGITQQGWDAPTQKAAEEQLWSSLEKAHELNPKGNVVATFHATSVPLPPAETIVKDENGKPKMVSMLYINPASGQLGQIKAEERYFGGESGKAIPFDPEKELAKKNDETWLGIISNLNFASQRGEEDLRRAKIELAQSPFSKLSEKQLEELKKENQGIDYNLAMNAKKEASQNLKHGKLHLLEASRNLEDLYNKMYSQAGFKQKEEMQKFQNEMTPILDKVTKGEAANSADLEKLKEAVSHGIDLMEYLKKEKVQIFKPLKEFAVEKAAETTANLALRGYNEFHDTAPIIAIENHPAFQSVLTTGQDLKEVVKKAQDNFVKKAQEEGMSESEARDQAKKLIGVTWDVGHINMIRKQGYGEKEIVSESKAVAPFVKKVHLADNFGFEHTELPMGMGNVPMEKIMKAIGKEGYDVKKVIEAGNWWQHFSGGGKAGGPLIPTLGGLGIPVYPSSESSAPTWNQVYGNVGPYFAGYGTMLPDMNFQTYGAGFSSLPMELGGQMAGKDSKFSGTPMA